MTRARRVRLAGATALTAAALIATACGPAPGTAHHEPPAEVHGARPESELTTLTLTDEAVRRLGIETAPCRRESLRPTRTYGGELQIPPGRSVTVTAPAAGTLLGPAGREVPSPGVALSQGEEVLRLVPLGLLPEQDLVRGEEEALARFEAAEARRDRAELLLSQGAGSRRQLEEAEAEFRIAQSALRSVTGRKALLNQATAEGRDGAVTAWSLTSPLGGRLVGVHAVPGQAVAQSAPLFDVVADRTLWVRVPVYAGDLGGILRREAATVRGLGDATGWSGAAASGAGSERTATWVDSPPVADPAAATIDAFYQLANADGAFRPGEKVAVTLRLAAASSEEETLVVPRSAVLYDIHGGTWVYLNPAPGQFVRERIEVRGVQDELAVLARGPRAGSAVVTVGAAELYGTEFGVGH